MTLLRLVGDVDGAAYLELLKFMSLHAATFSLTMWHKPTSSMLDAIEQLRPFEAEVRVVSEWPGTRLMPGRTAQLHVYKVDAESIASLQRMAKGLYSWRNYDLPDDLCFYRADASVLLETIASEDAAALHLRDDELQDLALFPAISVRRALKN